MQPPPVAVSAASPQSRLPTPNSAYCGGPNVALAQDLAQIPDADFPASWRALKKHERDSLPEAERTKLFDRYIALITHGQVEDASEQEQGWNEEYQTAPPDEPIAPKRGNGKHPTTTAIPYATTAESLGVMSRRLSDVQMRPVSWLWQGKLACGKVSLIQGDPGLGKSMLLASLAAVVTRGGAWPVTRDKCPQGSVLILSAEDDAEDTLAPRLEAAGADLSRVHTLDAIQSELENGEKVTRGFDLSQDIARLIVKMREIGDVRLVSIDPVLAYVGQTKDSHKTSDVRGILAPLNVAAYEAGAAIILVNHLNKSTGMSAINRGTGSNAWAAAARAVFGVIADKEDQGKRYFLTLKNNLGADGTETNLSYRIESYQLPASDPEIITARIMWDSQPVTQTAKELFAQNDAQEDDKTDTQEAKEYLKELLRDGPMKVQAIQITSRKAGHNWPTIRLAKRLLNIVSKRSGFGEGSSMEWALPNVSAPRTYSNKDD